MEFVQIINITKEKRKTKVYDLSIDKDTSYNIDELIVHNSAGGSLVAFLLGIHRIDPLLPVWGGNMDFDRFLSSHRALAKIVVYDKDGTKQEFVETDEIEVMRKKIKINIKAIELQEGDKILSFERKK
jgi:hypothetical protein